MKKNYYTEIHRGFTELHRGFYSVSLCVNSVPLCVTKKTSIEAVIATDDIL
jgi:hypothetical protein